MKPYTKLLLLPFVVVAFALSACTQAGDSSSSGAAVPVRPTDVPARPPVDTAKPAETAGDAVTGICDAGRESPGAVVSLPDLNATDGAKEELREEVSGAIEGLDPSDPTYEILSAFVKDEETNAAETCEALEKIERSPDQPATTGGSLSSAISSVGPVTARANLGIIEDACADEACLEELAAWRAWLEANCASESDCADEKVAFLLLFGRQPSRAQEQNRICPATGCATIGDLLDSVAQFETSGGTEGGEEGSTDRPADPGAPVDASVVDSIVSALEKGGDTAMTVDELREHVIAECPECEEIFDELIERLRGLTAASDPDVDAVAEEIRSGNPVLPGDLARALEYVTANP
jgi:hypothetical protein